MASRPRQTPPDPTPGRAVAVVDEHGREVVALRPALAGERGPRLDPAAEARLLTLVEQSIPAASNLWDAGSATYHLVFAPEIARGLKDGTYTMMESKAVEGAVRASAVGADSKIAGNASLLKAGRLRHLAVAAYSIGVVAFQQAELAEINERLDRIERLTRDVLSFLEEERRGKIAGNLRYLREAAPVLLAGGADEEVQRGYAAHIGDIVREMMQVSAALQMERERQLAELRGLDLSRAFASVDDDVDRVLEAVAAYERAAHTHAFSLYVEVEAARLQALIPGHAEAAGGRVERLREEVEGLAEELTDVAELTAEMAGRVSGVVVARVSKYAIEALRSYVRERAWAALAPSVETARGIRSAGEHLERVNERRRQIAQHGVRYVIERTDDGRRAVFATPEDS